jgi:hypothetical protein
MRKSGLVSVGAEGRRDIDCFCIDCHRRPAHKLRDRHIERIGEPMQDVERGVRLSIVLEPNQVRPRDTSDTRQVSEGETGLRPVTTKGLAKVSHATSAQMYTLDQANVPSDAPDARSRAPAEVRVEAQAGWCPNSRPRHDLR